jgi:hypothetical protein
MAADNRGGLATAGVLMQMVRPPAGSRQCPASAGQRANGPPKGGHYRDTETRRHGRCTGAHVLVIRRLQVE